MTIILPIQLSDDLVYLVDNLFSVIAKTKFTIHSMIGINNTLVYLFFFKLIH